MSQDSPEKHSWHSVSAYNVETCYQELAHTNREADKSQYLQGQHSFHAKANTPSINKC